MPIYRYQCKKCDKVFEYLKTGASDIPKCEACGSKDLDKLVTAFSVRCDTPQTASHGCSTGSCSCSHN